VSPPTADQVEVARRLLEALTSVGGNPQSLSPEDQEALSQLDPPLSTATVTRAQRRQFTPAAGKEAGSEALGAWFLGPKGENAELFKKLVALAIDRHVEHRLREYPHDPEWLTVERKRSEAYQRATDDLEKELRTLTRFLGKSVPFFSYRYQAHMLWDTTLPALLGYFAAMLYNQNNVAAEASPVTTWFEKQVGTDLCHMLGYGKDAWGHVTCDGSVANMEALWAARNLKYYPLALAAALTREPALEPARGLDVELPTGERKVLVELDPWQLLNLKADDVLALSGRLKTEYKLSSPDDVDALLAKYTVQELGLLEFTRRFAPLASDPVVLAPATMHYSWPKGASLVGLGRAALRSVPVDLDGRMDVRELRRILDRCLRDRVPVALVVSVLGTTCESAVDPLADIVALRETYRAKGLEFWLHVDAAWGGYFASMLREPPGGSPPEIDASGDSNTRFFDPSVAMSAYVTAQYKVLASTDSITVDPHKSGYVPYPAGGLCYRNSAMRHLVAFTSPVVYKGDTDPTVGVYGIEGSKPGAAAAAAYLSHRVIRPDQTGYGRILGRCLWSSKRVYAGLVTMPRKGDPFRIVTFQRLPSERANKPHDEVAREKELLRDHVVGASNEELIRFLSDGRKSWFRELGSDQIIVTYAFNFEKNGVPNDDVHSLNRLNRAIFVRLSSMSYAPPEASFRGDGEPRSAPPSVPRPEVPLFVTSSQYDPATYGPLAVGSFKRRLGVRDDGTTPIDVLVTTTMDPWLTDTAEGNFVPKLMAKLREVVIEEVRRLSL
jgi:glutamate/tyrosine decarboxylase-like PLP-dependent enzyme